MTGVLRTCLQSILKLVNAIIGMVGMALIIYALWLIRVWQRHMDGFSRDSPHSPIPWFIYASLGLGVSLCMIACSGHVAAETANGHCLSCYMVFIMLLTLLEAAVTADIYLNHDWEEDFPYDPTGKFDDFKHFVSSNFDFCKWVGLSVVAAQGLSVLLSMVLKALGSEQGQYYDSDDDYAPATLPLLVNQVHPSPYIVGQPHLTPKNDSWNIRIHEKTNSIVHSRFGCAIDIQMPKLLN
ncbi:hypothetical protein IFM89_025050, partial [Coptis chinensis]